MQPCRAALIEIHSQVSCVVSDLAGDIKLAGAFGVLGDVVDVVTIATPALAAICVRTAITGEPVGF